MLLQQTILIHGETSYPHYYLCHYLPLSTKTNSLSLSLLKFKRGRQPDLKVWIDRSLETLATITTSSGNMPVPPVTHASPAFPVTAPSAPGPFVPPDSILLRALHHDETSIRENTPTSLDKLAKTLAENFHSHYCPRFLRKSGVTCEIKELSKDQRASELKNRYYTDPRYLPASYQLLNPAPILSHPLSNPAQLPNPNPPANPTFLLIDDILTTGTTMQMIITAILPSFPKANLVIFTLAKADYYE